MRLVVPLIIVMDVIKLCNLIIMLFIVSSGLSYTHQE
jgi:hypothetical protein